MLAPRPHKAQSRGQPHNKKLPVGVHAEGRAVQHMHRRNKTDPLAGAGRGGASTPPLADHTKVQKRQQGAKDALLFLSPCCSTAQPLRTRRATLRAGVRFAVPAIMSNQNTALLK